MNKFADVTQTLFGGLKDLLHVPQDPLDVSMRRAGFRVKDHNELPSREFHYPEFVANGNPELHRFVGWGKEITAPESRKALSDLEIILRSATKFYIGSGEAIVKIIEEQVPRMQIREQYERATIYSRYEPFLVVARMSEGPPHVFVVKPDVNPNMIWFSLTSDEQDAVFSKITNEP